jgi:hypothetical protein
VILKGFTTLGSPVRTLEVLGVGLAGSWQRGGLVERCRVGYASHTALALRSVLRPPLFRKDRGAVRVLGLVLLCSRGLTPAAPTGMDVGTKPRRGRAPSPSGLLPFLTSPRRAVACFRASDPMSYGSEAKVKVDRDRDLRRHRREVLAYARADHPESDIARHTGLTVGQVRLILIAWLPR